MTALISRSELINDKLYSDGFEMAQSFGLNTSNENQIGGI
jgi:hypothetical protein